jgi:spermidine/putrescine transport system substrate-binding protein
MDERLWEGLGKRPISRRRLLGGALSASAVAFLAACSKTVKSPTGGTTTTPVPTKLEDALSIYNWENYINPDTVTKFTAEFGVTPTLDFYPSNEDLEAKIKAGATGYDVCAPTLYMVQIMGYEDGTLLELDHSLIPNLTNCDPTFLNTVLDPGNKYSVPKDTGTTGFGYRSDKVSETMTSWEDFYSLASKYSGRYTVLDSAPEVIGSALKLLGYSYNSDSGAEVDKATDELVKLKPHLRSIDSVNYDVMLQDGDAWVTLGWNGDVLVAAGNAPAGTVHYVVPSEGTEVWVDNWCILKAAPHPAISHTFLNWILTPENQGLETSYTYYASAVDAAKEFVDPAVAGDPAVYPEDTVLSKLEVFTPTPDILQLRTDAFAKFKAA